MATAKMWRIEATFKCHECDWYSNAKTYSGNTTQARKHHETTGHFVTGEVIYHYEYGREPT